MKKSILIILTLVAVIGVAFAFSGCNVVDEVKNWTDQLTCEHVWMSTPEEKVEPTCDKAGYTITKCQLCGKLETEDLPMTEHTRIQVAKVEPTCTEAGFTSYYKCEKCEKILTPGDEIAPLGHIEKTITGYNATCTEYGLTDSIICEREGCKTDEGTQTILVEAKVIPAHGHKVVQLSKKDPTCTETGLTAGQRCQYCTEIYVGLEVIPAKGHTGHMGEECTVCEEIIPVDIASVLAGEYTTTSVNTGESLANNYVYRIKKTGNGFADLSGIDCNIDLGLENVTVFFTSCHIPYSKGYILFVPDGEVADSAAMQDYKVSVDQYSVGTADIFEFKSVIFEGLSFYQDEEYVYFYFYGDSFKINVIDDIDWVNVLIPSLEEAVENVAFSLSEITIKEVKGDVERLVY